MKHHTIRVPETPSEIACPSCGVIATPVIGPGNGPHAFRALCSSCGTFLKWISKYPPAEREARRLLARLEAIATRAPSQPQLNLLQSLGDTGPTPANMAEASRRIDTLRRQGVA